MPTREVMEIAVYAMLLLVGLLGIFSVAYAVASARSRYTDTERCDLYQDRMMWFLIAMLVNLALAILTHLAIIDMYGVSK